ncbi:aldose 1-epimerase [Stigmatella aurantiaca]|uniref:Aldose 1-epimerase family protein n=1 Tax=Stigmatella aurantiaca (strain DW4/3-1) TaxID=378806 RepID=E3FLQ0_STIAD|nr:aldose 1-epimerase [Stigmatella aurantiaca]ADO74314.1 Aldose 1-epimerase family protein [Stigmatella aurantiaca DW4/3-1]
MPFQGLGGLETYALVDGECRVEVIPSRGALISRMSVAGDEVLYLDESTVVDPSKNVRGGIPVLFPTAGRLPGDTYPVERQAYTMAQHGFARKLPWEVRQVEKSLLVMGLSSSEETLRQFPWRFDAQLALSLEDSRLTIDFDLENRDTRPLPLHLGFHPYFHVTQSAKAVARVESDATHAWDNQRGLEIPINGLDLTAPEVDLHLRDHSRPGTTLHRGPGRRPVHLTWSPEFQMLVIWTLQGRDFVCVEPWTAAAGALATGEGLLTVAPEERLSLAFDIEG